MADQEKLYDIVESVKATGKLKKGVNEVTKVLEKGSAKIVIVAKDVNPKEVVMHLPILAKEKGIPCFDVDSKEELGAAAGLTVPTAAVAVIQEGEARNMIKALAKAEEKPKEEKPAEPKKKEEKPKEEKKAEEKPKEKKPKKEEKKAAKKEEKK